MKIENDIVKILKKSNRNIKIPKTKVFVPKHKKHKYLKKHKKEMKEYKLKFNNFKEI